MNGALLVIGSLYWDKHELREMLRNEFLEMGLARRVPVPIRYGRKSDKRDTYTMVFSMECVAESRLGQGYLIPIKQSFDSSSFGETTKVIIDAEHKETIDFKRFNWGWGCLALLVNPKKENDKNIKALKSYWNDKYSTGFKEGDYKVGDEDPCVNSNGLMQIPWLEEYNDFDFIVATATKPEVDNYPDYIELASKFKDDQEYFRKNYKKGIYTFRDVDIWNAMGYQHTKLGWIPMDWKIMELGEECIIRGRIGWKGLKQSEYVNDGPYLIASKHINNGNVNWEKCDHITLERYNESIEIGLEKGDVIFSKDGSLGNPALMQKLPGRATINSTMMLLRPNNILTPSYLYCCMNSNLFKRLVVEKVSGGAIPHIFQRDMKSFLIPLAPHSEQLKIAEIISNCATITQNLCDLIKAKEKQKKGLMQQLLRGKKRLPGFEDEWEEVKMGDVFKRINRKNVEGNTNVVTISAQRGLVRQDTYFKKNVASEILDNYFLLHRNEFAYNKSYSNGYPKGAIKKLKLFDKAVVTTLYICFDVKDEGISSRDFFEHFFEAGLLNRGLTQIAHEGGRAHGLLNVTPSDFLNLKIKIPDFMSSRASPRY